MPPEELPPEITVTDLGGNDVRFALPPRQLGPLRHVGWLFVAGGGLVAWWAVWIGATNVTRLNRPIRPEDYFMLGIGAVFVAFALFPIWLGLAILAGRREVTVRGNKLRTTERVGWLGRTKRWPLDKLAGVQIVGFFPTPAAGPKAGTLLSRLDALAGVLENGTRFMIAPAFPRALLRPLAAELARRCDVKFSADAEPVRPWVEVTTLVPAPQVEDAWNDGPAGQPASSRAVVDEYPEGVTITLPPLGYRGGVRAMAIGGGVIVLVTGLIIGLADRLPLAVYAGCAVFGIIGSLVAHQGIRVARRRVVIAVVGGRLMVLQTSLTRSQERAWDVGDLSAVRVGKSGIEINEEPLPELQIVPRDEPKYGMLAGRDLAEIRWIASVLRERLGLPVASK